MQQWNIIFLLFSVIISQDENLLLRNILKLRPLFVQRSQSAQHSHLMVGTGPVLDIIHQ